MDIFEELDRAFDMFMNEKEMKKGTGKIIKKIKIVNKICCTPFYDSVWMLEVLTNDDEVVNKKFRYYDYKEFKIAEILKECKTIGDIEYLDKTGMINYN
ncbi:hypothetical protein [Clostridium akagii]|uniref:hypothetical protein n=1 Tax=Clostridium akagii TaxID=91623 RepID=UPI00047E5E3F|nr:hypothetical protein [Clostridium akagii]